MVFGIHSIIKTLRSSFALLWLFAAAACAGTGQPGAIAPPEGSNTVNAPGGLNGAQPFPGQLSSPPTDPNDHTIYMMKEDSQPPSTAQSTGMAVFKGHVLSGDSLALFRGEPVDWESCCENRWIRVFEKSSNTCHYVSVGQEGAVEFSKSASSQPQFEFYMIIENGFVPDPSLEGHCPELSDPNYGPLNGLLMEYEPPTAFYLRNPPSNWGSVLRGRLNNNPVSP
jgi:hypothetical protein